MIKSINGRGNGARSPARRTFLGSVVKVAIGLIIQAIIPSPSIAVEKKGRFSLLDLKRLVRGVVVGRNEPGYEKWRRSMIWQMRKPKRYPNLIVKTTTIREIREAIQYARSNGLKIAVRSGGHNEWGNFLRSNGMLLDMSNFNGLTFDPDRSTVCVGPSVWGYRLFFELAKQGCVFPIAHAPTVPLGGFLLGGGLGINWDNCGVASCFSILDADVVTAEGVPVHVSSEHHPELFWALRGSGNGFPGIVTRLNLRTYSLPRFIAKCEYEFTEDHIPAVVDWTDEILERGLSKSELGLGVMYKSDSLRASRQVKSLVCTLRNTVFADSEQEARSILGQIRDDPIARDASSKHEFVPTDYETVLMGRPGMHQRYGLERRATDCLWTYNLKDALVQLSGFLSQAPDPRRARISVTVSTIQDPLPDAAFSVKEKAYIGYGTAWDNKADDASHLSWLRKSSTQMETLAGGYYINDVDVNSNAKKVHGCFSKQAWERILAVRQKYDPENTFYNYFGLEA